jgi:deazaflavin-dependent oxidoreductase (nitroreductase family)
MDDMKAINPAIIDEYRRTSGKLSGVFDGVPVLLLTTTGRRSGTPHTTPLGYIEDDGGFVVVASAGGAAADPDWYRNLAETGSATIQVGAEQSRVSPTVALGPERQRLFDRLAEALPPLAGYVQIARRTIPVVILTPDATPSGGATQSGASVA